MTKYCIFRNIKFINGILNDIETLYLRSTMFINRIPDVNYALLVSLSLHSA